MSTLFFSEKSVIKSIDLSKFIDDTHFEFDAKHLHIVDNVHMYNILYRYMCSIPVLHLFGAFSIYLDFYSQCLNAIRFFFSTYFILAY